MSLLEHIKNINAKSKEWMAKNPGSWAGMVTEDIKYWNDQGIFTVEDYERDSLITSVYEMHKDAYGAKESMQQEKEYEESCYQTFLKRITEAMKLGAETKEDAIKWILQAEGLENEKDPGYICYNLGLNYDKEYLFKTKH